MVQVGQLDLGNGRLQRYGLIGVSVLLGGLIIRGAHDLFSPIQVNEARLQIPSLPVKAPTELVVAQERGRMGELFVREGAAVAPGQNLFLLKRDPEVEQDLVDRGLARDLAETNDQIRDIRRAIDGLSERQVLVRPIANPDFAGQIRLAKQRLARRQQLMQDGGLSRDFVDEAQERLLRLQRDAAQWQEDRNKLRSLEALRQRQLGRLVALDQQQFQLRSADQQRRIEARLHPPLNLTTQSQLDYASYRSPSRGTVLRLFKQPGDPVRPYEAVALIQNDIPAPVVEATVPMSKQWLLMPAQQARVEIPSLRQRYQAQTIAVQRSGDALQRIRFRLIGVPPDEIRRLLALPGEPVKLWIPREHLLVRWLRTRDLRDWSTS